jgi:hypothetical protein
METPKVPWPRWYDRKHAIIVLIDQYLCKGFTLFDVARILPVFVVAPQQEEESPHSAEDDDRPRSLPVNFMEAQILAIRRLSWPRLRRECQPHVENPLLIGVNGERVSQ